jgi:hypothetical protein
MIKDVQKRAHKDDAVTCTVGGRLSSVAMKQKNSVIWKAPDKSQKITYTLYREMKDR